MAEGSGDPQLLEGQEMGMGATYPRPDTAEGSANHTEWNGWLYCEREQEPFDWETGDVECPHCGEGFYNPPPEEPPEPSEEPTPSDDGGGGFWRDVAGMSVSGVMGLIGLYLLEASQTSVIPLLAGILLIMLAPKAHRVIYNG